MKCNAAPVSSYPNGRLVPSAVDRELDHIELLIHASRAQSAIDARGVPGPAYLTARIEALVAQSEPLAVQIRRVDRLLALIAEAEQVEP
jgi:hypothetical protein